MDMNAHLKKEIIRNPPTHCDVNKQQRKEIQRQGEKLGSLILDFWLSTKRLYIVKQLFLPKLVHMIWIQPQLTCKARQISQRKSGRRGQYIWKQEHRHTSQRLLIYLTRLQSDQLLFIFIFLNSHCRSDKKKSSQPYTDTNTCQGYYSFVILKRSLI